MNARHIGVPLAGAPRPWCDELWWAAAVVRAEGGFAASVRVKRIAAARLWLGGCAGSPSDVLMRLRRATPELLQLGIVSSAQLGVPVGCIPAMDVRDHGGGNLDIVLYATESGTSSRRVLWAAARAMAPSVAHLSGCSGSPEIRLGSLEVTRVTARCRLTLGQLIAGSSNTAGTRASLARLRHTLRRFQADEHDPVLAARHNEVVIDAMAAAASALGLEPWRVAAAARSHAARWGSHGPLVRWRRRDGSLTVKGELELPADLESVEQLLSRARPGAMDGRGLAGALLQQVACVGLAASLAVLRGALALSQAEAGEGPLTRAAVRESGVHRRAGAMRPAR